MRNPTVVHAQSEAERTPSDCIERIDAIEAELQKQGTSILEVLNEQKLVYSEKVNTDSDEEKPFTVAKLDAVEKSISDFADIYYGAQRSRSRALDDNAYAAFPSHVSPYCTCNLLPAQPCAECIVYQLTKLEVVAVAAGFYMRRWTLANDLLWMNLTNRELDMDYWPTLGSRIAEAPQIAHDLAYNEELAFWFDHKSPGFLHGIFESTIEGDTYNALGDFYFQKRDAGNGNVDIYIIDRYDWNFHEYQGLAEALNNTMVSAQNLGILTPFYTRIHLTIPGTVPFNWEYTDSGVAITGVAEGTTTVEWPKEIYDLRERPKDKEKPPVVSITSIEQRAFAGQTGITELTLPQTVTEIGERAFEGCSSLTSVSSLDSVKSFGNYAFAGCSALTAVTIPQELTAIGTGAFAGCDSLAIRVAANNPNYTAQDNILYNKHKTALLSSGNVAPEVHILQTVETIATSAFQGNGKLQNVHIEHCPAIGKFAFADCENLRAAYFYSYTVPTLGNAAFANNDFTLYAPHHLQGTYHSAFYGYTTKIDSIPIEISFMVDGAEWQCVPTYFGANIDTIPEPFREGYDFAGWYDSADYAGQVYAAGGTWTTAQDMCVYAKWTPKQYQIYFTGDGSEGLADKTVTYDSPIGTLPTPERKGYTFLGWYDVNGEQYAETDDWKKLSNISVSSKWRINEYTISYDGNGGTVSESSQKATYQCVIDSLAVATKEGFTFLEWNTAADGTGKTVRAPYTYDSDDDLTLYAQYSQNQYTVTFNKQNGSGGSNGVDVNYQATMPTGLTAPTRPGYAFQGYYAQPNGEGTCYYDRNMTGNAVWDFARNDTIYAYWVGNTYNVSLHRQGGTGGCDSVQATYGSAMPTGADITAPTKTGYVFRGYYADPNGKGTQYYHADMTSANPWNISEDKTLYAYWTAKVYTVTLNRQSGSGGSASVQATYYAAMPTATAPIRSGYTFQGYYEKPNGAGTKYYHANMASANIWDIADNKEIYAYWTGNQYNVKLDSGGYGGTGEVNATFGSPMPTAGIVAPRRTGYTFKGYYDQRNGNGAKYYDGPNFVSVHVWDKTSGCTLYAYWEQNTYTITLQQYGNNTSEIKVKYGDAVTVEDFAPGRWGYQFIGYYANANGTGTEYFTAEWQTYYGSKSYMLVSRNVRWYQESDGVIYAKWAVCSMNYDIHYYSTEDASIIYTETVRLVNEQTITLGAKEVKGYVFKQWDINGATYTDTTITYKASLIYSYVVQGTMIAAYPYDTPGSIYAMYDKDSCVAEGTLITLSDGRQVPVETLTGNELLLVWNLKTGRFDTAPILFIDKDPTRMYRVINLYFSDGTTVKVISEHGFWDCDLNRYVYLDENAAQYIGHWFSKSITDGNGQMTRVKVRLENVVVRDEYTTAYSPVTYQHLCYYVNGMLSMPGGIGGLFNIFEVDGETMQYDSAAMAADISKYGLFTYEEFAEYVPVPVEVFEAFDAQYFKVAIGKGMLDYQTLNRLAERYAPLLGMGGDA